MPIPSLESPPDQKTIKTGRLGFAGFVLDREAGRLLGQDGEIRLRPQAFRLLEVLVGAAPRILSVDELLDQAWGVEHLSPASVKQAVSEIRQALGDDPARPSIIETVHRRGYRVIAQVRPVVRTPDLSTRPIMAVPESGPVVLERAEPETVPSPRLLRRMGVVLAVLVLSTVSLGVASRFLPQAPETRPARADAPAARPALAILGFKNLSADPQDDWISGALSETLAFELTAAGRVRMIPAEAVAAMKRELALPGSESQSRAGLGRIARNLGTDLVLTGSYLKEEGGRLRLQALLQDARTGETVSWAREAGTREELASLATAAARGLQATLRGPASPAAPVEAAALAANGGSLRLYTEALERLRRWDTAAALALLERAAALDPDSPLIQDALADAAFRLGFESRAREASGRAVALGRELPRQIRLGIEARSHEVRGEWERAATIYTELRRAWPDDLEHGLRLAKAQLSAGQTPASLATIAGLRRLASPAGDDPRLDLAEGDALFKLGEYRRALEAAERGIAGAERRGLFLVAAAGRSDRAWSLSRLGRQAEALADFATARTLYLRTGDRGAAAASQLGRASVLQSTGRTAEAWKAYEEGISTLRAVGDRRLEAKALNNFASVLGDEGDYAGVVPLLERSLEIKREVGDLQSAAMTLVNLGNVLRIQGDLPGAHRRIQEGLGLSRSLDDAHTTAYALRAFARLLSKEKRTAEARSALEEAIRLTSRMGEGDGTAEARLALGELEAQSGRPDQARAQFEQALAEFRRLGQPGDAAFALLRLGGLSQDQKRYEEARTRYREALLLAQSIRNAFYEAHLHVGLAEVEALLSRREAARAEYNRALAMWEEQKNEAEGAKVRKALAELAGARPDPS